MNKKFNKEPWLKYIEGSKIDKKVLNAFIWLINKVKSRAQEIISSYEVEFTEEDPYKTSLELRKDLKQNKIKVFTWWEDHPAWSREDNNLFRLVHDIDWHWLDLSFSLNDEIKTHQKLVDKLLLNTEESRALYTEIVWQVTAYYITGEYQKQKAIFIN